MDPFLLAHIIRPFHFDISGKLSPSSIRDQMFRARVIVDRAYAGSLIGSQRSLLVVGAGAAGATAAIRASQLGVPTFLIEREDSAFSRQAVCDTRWVCPTQYDWPLEHWDKGFYPWAGPSMPLPWTANYANVLAGVWEHELSRACARYRNLFFLTKTIVDRSHCNPDGSFVVKGSGLEVHLDPYGGPLEFGMALSCTGPGMETSRIGNYRGFDFWETDPFEKPSFGLATGYQPRALITGGGDGALQDFLRVVTKKKSADELYRALSPHIRHEIENKIQAADEQSQRAYAWGDKWYHDCTAFRSVHDIYKSSVEDLIRSASWPAIKGELDDITYDSSDELSVTLVHPCDHFTKSYSLNRFLVLLIAEYLKEKYPAENYDGYYPIRENTAVIDVRGSGHTCGDPIDCHGEEHVIEFGYANCEIMDNYLSRKINIPRMDDDVYEVVIVRHGVKSERFIIGAYQLSSLRHLLPYYVAW